MTIQSFIEKAIEGGWRPKAGDGFVYKKCVFFTPSRGGSEFNFTDMPQRNVKLDFVSVPTERILLDPLAWKAVVRAQNPEVEDVSDCDQFYADIARARMHRMIDALAEGKTIEQYLETL